MENKDFSLSLEDALRSGKSVDELIDDFAAQLKEATCKINKEKEQEQEEKKKGRPHCNPVELDDMRDVVINVLLEYADMIGIAPENAQDDIKLKEGLKETLIEIEKEYAEILDSLKEIKEVFERDNENETRVKRKRKRKMEDPGEVILRFLESLR